MGFAKLASYPYLRNFW